MAALSPSWASETPGFTPRRTTKELDPERIGLAVAGRHAEHLAPAVGVDADGDDHRDGDVLMIAANFDASGIESHIRPIAFDRAVDKRVHASIDFPAQPDQIFRESVRGVH